MLYVIGVVVIIASLAVMHKISKDVRAQERRDAREARERAAKARADLYTAPESTRNLDRVGWDWTTEI